MNRLLVLGATAIAAVALASTPAVVGLAGNASFSHQIPVRVPQDAKPVVLVGDETSVGPTGSVSRTPAPPSSAARSDHGGAEGDKSAERGSLGSGTADDGVGHSAGTGEDRSASEPNPRTAESIGGAAAGSNSSGGGSGAGNTSSSGVGSNSGSVTRPTSPSPQSSGVSGSGHGGGSTDDNSAGGGKSNKG